RAEMEKQGEQERRAEHAVLMREALVEARQQRGPERPVRKQGGGNNEPQSDDCVLHNDVCPCPRARSEHGTNSPDGRSSGHDYSSPRIGASCSPILIQAGALYGVPCSLRGPQDSAYNTASNLTKLIS
ncbi:MAG: hypothetical protein ACPIOQ_72540, partial [Promethearchaeia archaeon]